MYTIASPATPLSPCLQSPPPSPPRSPLPAQSATRLFDQGSIPRLLKKDDRCGKRHVLPGCCSRAFLDLAPEPNRVAYCQTQTMQASGYCGAGGSMTERGTRATGSSDWGAQHPFSGMPPRPPAAAPGRRPSTRHQPLQARAAASSYSTRDEWLDDMLRASAEIAARLHSGTRLDVPPSPHPHPPEPQTFSPSSTFLTQTQDMDDDPGKARNGVRPVQRYMPEPLNLKSCSTVHA
jgi:hypothetical protein